MLIRLLMLKWRRYVSWMWLVLVPHRTLIGPQALAACVRNKSKAIAAWFARPVAQLVRALP